MTVSRSGSMMYSMGAMTEDIQGGKL
jgi:hypothetical protein